MLEFKAQPEDMAHFTYSKPPLDLIQLPQAFPEPRSVSIRPSELSDLPPGQAQSFPSSPTILNRSAFPRPSGDKANKRKRKKREDRKHFSKRALAGTNCSKVRKSDNEAGNRYCQAIDMSELARACSRSNPNIEQNAAPRNGSAGPWVTLKANNIATDVRQDGVEPSRWNKSSVNGSAILILDHSNAHFDDEMKYVGELITRVPKMSQEQIVEELSRYQYCLRASKETRGEADYMLFSERMDCT